MIDSTSIDLEFFVSPKINRINNMGRSSSKCWAGRGVAFAVLFFVCAEASGRGYLTSVGPGQFRFQKVIMEDNELILPRTSQNGNDTEANSMNVASKPFDSPVTIDSSKVLHIGPELAHYLSPLYLATSEDVDLKDFIAFDAGHSSGITTTSSSSANNLLVVTPQMLVNYFKPGTTSTNGGGTSVLLPVGFNPPGNNATPPSSQAIYKSP